MSGQRNTAEDFVKAHFRNATAKYFPPIREIGMSNPIQDGTWVIKDAHEIGAQELGFGRTKAEAWQNAADTIQKRDDIPT